MAEGAINVLMHRNIACPLFDVDNTQEYVPLKYWDPGFFDQGILYSELDCPYLYKGDSFIILSYGFTMPLGFELAQIVESGSYHTDKMLFSYVDGATLYPVPGYAMLVYPHGCNYELNYGMMFDFPKTSLTNDSYRLSLSILGGEPMRVSMFNIPSVLNGKRYYCPFYLKIAHTLPMSV